jgi:hypothetical protein
MATSADLNPLAAAASTTSSTGSETLRSQANHLLCRELGACHTKSQEARAKSFV